MLQMFYNVAVVVIFVAVNCEIEYPNVEYCPVVQNCRAPLIYNVKYRCASDKMCPQGYKCCRSDCYIHKVCVVAVNKNGEKIPLPIVTTDGYTELNAKETELIYTTEVDNVTEDITITENNSASIIIETTTNFSDKSEEVSSTNSIEEENITIADRFSDTDTAVTQMETLETTIYDKSTESTQNTSNVSNWIVDVGGTDETEVTTKTTILLTVTEQFTKLTTNTKNEEDVEGSGGFYTNDDEDKVSSEKDFTSTSSTHIIDDEDVIQGSGSGRGGDTYDNIVFPDDDRMTTFKPARDKHTTSNIPPTDKDFGFDTYFTPDTTASTHNANQSAIENIRTSSESFPTYIPEQGSGNDLTDNDNGENITETSTVKDNFTNRTSTVTTSFAGVTYKNKSGTNTDEIDIDSPSSTIKHPDIVEKTTVVAIVEGSGNEFSDTENGDVDEEMTTYIPDNKKETIIEDSTKSSLNVTTPLIDLSVITVTEDEDDDDYDHDGVDEDIRNNFQGRIISG
ncbi:hypothetical protein RN001_013316 [Aquatica leii]|uniref:WAP domain-containing protein n=1 Tax=Aquatica leii TaxID=1421715 RepID=A0AAN7P296_9COLE|nr:hypothetical protein RN001_013316 [Aquatica leii]